MGCPKCQCEEISPSGMCLWCGYQINASGTEPEPIPEERGNDPESSELKEPADSTQPVEEELPEWRQELSQRLHSIKQKRKSPEDVEPAQSESAPAAKPEISKSSVPQPESRQPAAYSRTYQDSQKSQQAQGLIDDRTLGQNSGLGISSPTADPFVPSAAVLDRDQDFVMLLSRVLSGLVDLIIIFLSAGFLVLAADIFSGVRILGLTSVFNYAVLLLLVYFLYSLFFLGISNQTIGMMMTNLRLAMDKSDDRPRIARVLLRSAGYLLSLLCLGAGLLWALFDRERRCFHDRLTSTRVVRA
jgi:uncharacterized RDD family membrane protein YckC